MSVVIAVAHEVRADGAFPDSQQILVPADRPTLIVLATTFGLIISDDGGGTWSWTCEPRGTTYNNLYQAGPSPLNRFYGISSNGLLYSEDESCTWLYPSGTLTGNRATDAFVDRANGNRVLAIAMPLGPTSGGTQVYVSSDGGSTFGAAIFTAPADAELRGIEIARSDPNTVYLAMNIVSQTHPFLVRSTDGGANWDPALDLEPAIGLNRFRIIAIDPLDSRKVFLRVTDNLSESLAVSSDAGATFSRPVTLAGRLTAFVRLANGTILVAGVDNTVPVGFRSTDGAASFTPWENVPSIRALAERDGTLFVAADNIKDGFALATSADEGRTLQPLMTFDKVASIKPCAQQACRDGCLYQSSLNLWPREICCSAPDQACAVTTKPVTPKSGCSCEIGVPPSRQGWEIVTALALVLICSFRKRSSRSRSG